MLLSELHGYKQYLGKSVRKVVHDLANKYGLLDSHGSRGVVLYGSKNYAYKLWMKDDGYEKWIEYASKHQHDPAIIKVLGQIKKLPFELKGRKKIGTDEEFDDLKYALKYVRIEKLQPMPENLAQAVQDAWNEVRYGDATIKTVKAAVEENNDSSVFKKYEKFFTTYMKVATDLRAANLHIDLHNENVMMRGDQLVIVDAAFEQLSYAETTAVDLLYKYDSELQKS